ncbi:BlaI/MecI/CopY family transcriptional regulator [Pseudonocardia sichuanensis]
MGRTLPARPRPSYNVGEPEALPWAATGDGGAVRRLGELEAVIMDRLWAVDDTATVRDVFEQLQQQRHIAYTTVMSTMDNLFRKGFLDRERDGRAYRYRTLTSRAAYRAELMQQALGTETDHEAVLTHFVGQLSEDERQRLQAVLQRSADAREKP